MFTKHMRPKGFCIDIFVLHVGQLITRLMVIHKRIVEELGQKQISRGMTFGSKGYVQKSRYFSILSLKMVKLIPCSSFPRLTPNVNFFKAWHLPIRLMVGHMRMCLVVALLGKVFRTWVQNVLFQV